MKWIAVRDEKPEFGLRAIIKINGKLTVEELLADSLGPFIIDKFAKVHRITHYIPEDDLLAELKEVENDTKG